MINTLRMACLPNIVSLSRKPASTSVSTNLAIRHGGDMLAGLRRQPLHQPFEAQGQRAAHAKIRVERSDDYAPLCCSRR